VFALADYDYRLPAERIAQSPAASRDASRLMHLGRYTGEPSHHVFSDLPALLRPGDLLVMNDTAVIPGRLAGRKADTGGRVEVLVVDFAGGLPEPRRPETFTCVCLVRAAKRTPPGTRLQFAGGLSAEILDRGEDGLHTLRFSGPQPFARLLDLVGRVPLPPYIRRAEATEQARASDRHAYQTVYARRRGAIAAPTAGLHFSLPLMDALRRMGVALAYLTLHVGYGTFLPVRVRDIREHRMHAERFTLPQETAAALRAARSRGGRVVAVGTTSLRTLEFMAAADGSVDAGSGQCDLFIYPGYRFRVVDALLTNFHLPQSTLLMLVAAFAGRERILDAYATAIAEGYRFYSYGDAMLIA
jgi:S-adenosylmethionine:tRNA ribosyltransferase-isomerase